MWKRVLSLGCLVIAGCLAGQSYDPSETPYTLGTAAGARVQVDPNLLDAVIRDQSMGTLCLQDFLAIEARYESLPGWRMGFAVDLSGRVYTQCWIYVPEVGSDLADGPPELLEP